MSTVLSSTWQRFRSGSHILRSQATLSLILRTPCPKHIVPFHFFRQFAEINALQQKAMFNALSLHRRANFLGRIDVPYSLEKEARCISFWKERSRSDIGDENDKTIKKIPLSPAQINRLFGRKTDAELGIKLLMDLQHQRLSGTLDRRLPYSATMVAKGLAWLRENDPLDEDAAILARIDRELDTTPQKNAAHSPQAISQLERLQQFNKEKTELDEQQEAAKEKAALKQEKIQTSDWNNLQAKKQTSPSTDLVKLRPEPEWVRKYRNQATNNDIEKLKISASARLLPSAILVVTVVALSLLFAQNYTPPSKNARLWPDLPPAAATIISIIGLNVLIFLLWRIPPLWAFMNRNFLIVPVYPHATAMLGAPFSHQEFSHLFANCCFLWLVGSRGMLIPSPPGRSSNSFPSPPKNTSPCVA